MTSIDSKALRSAFSQYITGVTVVTTKNHSGTLVGFTANSFTSVSLDPPLLLVCPGNHLNSFSSFETCDTFAVNVLSESQEAVSNEFARSNTDRFSNVAWQADDNGCPVIDGCCATFSCRVHARLQMGDHMVLVGEVVGFNHQNAPGLGYCRDGYFTLRKEREANAALTGAGTVGCAGVLLEYDGHILLAGNDKTKAVPHIELADGQGPRATLTQHFESLGLAVTIGPVYSVFDEAHSSRRYTFFTASAESASTGGLGQFHKIDTLSQLAFADTAQTDMVHRFQGEFQVKAFGLYLGDTQHGEIHHAS